jgi:hypothetical protein|tara:strand:+ start:14364 stop:14603 length:240 start_codon:yes stop_codon:yes gene_type:complete
VVAKNDVGDILELVLVVMCIDLNVVKDSAGDFHYGDVMVLRWFFLGHLLIMGEPSILKALWALDKINQVRRVIFVRGIS